MDKQEDGSGNVRLERQVRRLPYEPAKTLLMISFPWCCVGALPRLLGIITPRIEFVRTLRVVDIGMCVLATASFAYVAFAIIQNARNRAA